jgi:phosphoglycerol transferase MdoB-like AlkP superfamily enzyme
MKENGPYWSRDAVRLLWIGTSFLVISIGTRIGLAIFSEGSYVLQDWFRFIPEFEPHGRFHKWETGWASVWATLFLTLFMVVAAAEFAFWGEFGSRFDFIAVDYLVYTHEVIGNIQESYPVGLWILAILSLSTTVAWFSWPRKGVRARSSWIVRWSRAALVGFALALGMFAVDPNLADTKLNAQVRQLSMNGMYAFGHAFRHNELDYNKYYPALEAADLNSQIRTLIRQSNSSFTSSEGIERNIAARVARKDVNVILISVESLSASFLGHFGNREGITPELDKLADQGLFFTSMYATGTRTVRGLEALSVGTPPTPGQSIVRRPKNEGLENLGEELGDAGWKPYWIYGGYGFFDNMNAYFKANKYTVVDRSDMDAEGLPIHHETIWGIADEDLYSLAFAKLDRENARGNRFFAHIMTTSNHRPYTFPDNRIDLKGKRRESAVKYTDWAIGDLFRRASKKPWFDNTLFIIIADHTSKAAGRIDLPPSRYHIPMIWYAPKLVKPGVMPRLMSQVDVGPTLMGWLGLSYPSRFFGYDMFNLEAGRERAFISTYQKLGYLKGSRLVVLDVNREPVVSDGLPAKPGDPPPLTDPHLIKEAISWYQAASRYFRSGQLKDVVDKND